MQDLINQHVIIFGASSGMGEEIAKACIARDMKVSMCARRLEKLKQISDSTAENIYIEKVDVQNKNMVRQFIKNAGSQFGDPCFVINCAGVMYYQLMQNRDHDQWLSMVNTNVIGLLNITLAIINPIIKSKGMFINITSDAGRKAFPGLSVYSGTKAFMEFMLSGLRQELIESGVRVVNVQPGNVKTPLQNMSTDKEAELQYGSQASDNFLNTKDIANTVLFAMTQPQGVALNEILIEPQKEPI